MSQVRDPDSIAPEAEAQRLRRAKLPAVLEYAFRPMFLAAGSWAVIALALWLAMFFGYVQLPIRFDPLAWHVHEMLFGFVMAAVAGFLLTAIPNWTGRLPVRNSPLAMLACLWMSDKQPLPTGPQLTAADSVFREHPHEYLDRLRTEDPVHRDAELGRLFLTRFEDVRAIV